jgi:hypothetical protein
LLEYVLRVWVCVEQPAPAHESPLTKPTSLGNDSDTSLSLCRLST